MINFVFRKRRERRSTQTRRERKREERRTQEEKDLKAEEFRLKKVA